MTEQIKNPHAVALGRNGGLADTPAQFAARAKNGAKGGRPRLTAAERKKRARKKSLKARKRNRRRR